MRLSLIVAMDRNRVIGRRGTLPWRLSSDLKRFKALTMGHHLIMGRKTFESLPKLLPGRTSIVVSRAQESLARRASEGNAAGDAEKLHFASSLAAAIALADADSEAFVIGGAQIYELALPRADRLYVTHVEADVDGDTFFPPIDWSQWRLLEQTEHETDTRNEFPSRFCIYDRITPS